ncbi:hornerin-like [Iris pallida]|uniref:Hornerin-like n=1 Tax=Iris pallida TaxID=29817 RepID=A0AAX6FGJ4_IRIPA|nr:hornerin-like [Iris pallida]
MFFQNSIFLSLSLSKKKR